MGRVKVDFPERQQFVICGYDKPMRTLYAQLYDRSDDTDDAPVAAVGYHPMERNPRERTEHGPYPAGFAELEQAMTGWGLTDDERGQVGAAIHRDLNVPAN